MLYKIFAAALLFTLSINAVEAGTGAGEGKSATAKAGHMKSANHAETPLDEIVDLCANDEAGKFEKEWRAYVDRNNLKGKQLDDTIAWVSKEAGNQRKKSHASMSEEEHEAWLQKRRDFMSRVAHKALNPAR